MFNLFKRKKKKDAQAVENTVVQEQKKEMPVFGTADHFMNTYVSNEHNLAIGRQGDRLITVTADSAPTNDIIVINDDWTSTVRQCIMPTIAQRQLSYVVYDPNGDCYNRVASTMKAKGYDVQLVDFEAEGENAARIDLFETANITKSPYWTSILLTSAINCEGDEIVVAHSLLMAMMLYGLELDQHIEIGELVDVFHRIKNNDKVTMLEVKSCKDADQYIKEFETAPEKLRKTVLKKVEENFLIPSIEKVTKPNIMTITAHNRQSIIFVKRVPKKYRYLATALMFNLTTSSVFHEGKGITTLVIDSASDDWYNRALMKKICKEASLGRKIAHMRIRKSLEDGRPLSAEKKQLVIYMHSDNQNTKDYVYNCMLVKSQLSYEEQAQISKEIYKGKPIPDSILDSSCVTMEDLDNMTDNVVIDTSKAARPFRCERLK
jgi:hypothetical protein